MSLGAGTVLAVFILFCRIGTCIMLMPGLSSTRIAPRIRLFIALSVTLVLAPLLLAEVEAKLSSLAPYALAGVLMSEILIGAMIGILGRLFFLALDTLATAVTMAIGFGAVPGVAIEDPEPQPALVSLVAVSAMLLLFITDLHWELLRGLSASYDALPVTEVLGPQPALMRVADALSESFLAALRITSPFIIYAVIVNFAIGLTNKLTPQIPIYFISLPFVLLGGLVLLYFVAPEMLHLFIDNFANWVATE